MYHLLLFLGIFWSFAHANVFTSIDGVNNIQLDCSRFKRDLDVIRSFGYTIQINPLITLEKTYAIVNTASQVEELSIYQETNVPLDVFCLTNLHTLRVNAAPFVAHISFDNILVKDGLSPLISRLTRLKVLSLINTTASHIPVESLGVLTNLTTLEVENCGLREIPSTISSLINLQQLRLPKNRLHSIPHDSALQRMTKLNYLDVSYNQIRDITDLAFLSSRAVITMDFSYNQIDYVPPEIGQFYNALNYLYLNDNKLNYIPTDIFRLYYMKKVDLQRNPLPTDEISAIKNRFRAAIPNCQILI